MPKHLVRFLLLRLLPGRVVPFLTVFEVLLLIRRLRRPKPTASAPRRIVTSAPPGGRIPAANAPAATGAPADPFGPTPR